MRTTVTLDADALRLLRDAMKRTGKSFKEVLNMAVRRGLGAREDARREKPFRVKAMPMRLRSGLDSGSMNRLVDELEVDAFLAKPRSQ